MAESATISNYCGAANSIASMPPLLFAVPGYNLVKVLRSRRTSWPCFVLLTTLATYSVDRPVAATWPHTQAGRSSRHLQAPGRQSIPSECFTRGDYPFGPWCIPSSGNCIARHSELIRGGHATSTSSLKNPPTTLIRLQYRCRHLVGSNADLLWPCSCRL